MAAHVVSRHPALSAASLPCPHPVPWYLLTAEIHQVLPIETDVAPLEDIVPVGMVEMRGCWEGDDPPQGPLICSQTPPSPKNGCPETGAVVP